MADLSEIRQALSEALPKNNVSGNSISVGFSNSTDIEVLMTGLAKLWDRKERERLAGLNKSLKDNQVANVKENSNFLGKLSEVYKSGITELLKQREEQNTKFSKSLAISITDSLTKFFKSYVNSAEKLGSFFQNIDRTGVILSGGLNQLRESAVELGMSQNDLLSTIKKTSPLLARLSGSGKDSLATFTRTVSTVNEDMLLTNEERVAAFENVMNRLTPTNLQVITQERLNVEIEKTAKNLKEMSYMTGKNVEALTEEQKIRDLNTRIGAMRQQERYKGIFDTLLPLGFSETQIMALISGGLDATLSNKDRLWLHRSDIQALSRAVRSGKINSSEDILNWRNENMAVLQRADMSRSFYANSPSHILAAGANPDLEYMYYNNPLLNLADNKSGYTDLDKDVLSNAIGAKRTQNRYNFLQEWARAGGVAGVNTALSIETAYYNYASEALNKIVNYLGSYTPIFIGLSQGIMNLAINSYNNGSSIGSKLLRGGLVLGGAGALAVGFKDIILTDQKGKSISDTATKGAAYGAIVGGAIGGSVTGNLKGAAYGAIVGASIGTITGIAKNFYDNGWKNATLFSDADTPGWKWFKSIVLGAAIGGAVGGGKGALYGALAGGAIGGGIVLVDKIKSWWNSTDDDSAVDNNLNIVTNQYKRPQVSQPENITQQSAVMMPQTVIKSNSAIYDSSDYWGEMIRLQRTQVDQGKTMIDWTKYSQSYRENKDTADKISQSFSTSDY